MVIFIKYEGGGRFFGFLNKNPFLNFSITQILERSNRNTYNTYQNYRNSNLFFFNVKRNRFKGAGTQEI